MNRTWQRLLTTMTAGLTLALCYSATAVAADEAPALPKELDVKAAPDKKAAEAPDHEAAVESAFKVPEKAKPTGEQLQEVGKLREKFEDKLRAAYENLDVAKESGVRKQIDDAIKEIVELRKTIRQHMDAIFPRPVPPPRPVRQVAPGGGGNAKEENRRDRREREREEARLLQQERELEQLRRDLERREWRDEEQRRLAWEQLRSQQAQLDAQKRQAADDAQQNPNQGQQSNAGAPPVTSGGGSDGWANNVGGYGGNVGGTNVGGYGGNHSSTSVGGHGGKNTSSGAGGGGGGKIGGGSGGRSDGGGKGGGKSGGDGKDDKKKGK